MAIGLASEPVVEQLIQEFRAAEIVHVDETPWHQKGKLRWMWVASTALETIFRIGSRCKEELIELIGEAFLGWLITDGYLAYRPHPELVEGPSAPPALPRSLCRRSDYADEGRELGLGGGEHRDVVGIIQMAG